MKIRNLLTEAALQRLQQPDVARLIVALSGGIDSVALLHALVREYREFREIARAAKPISAIHVNHNLQPAAVDFQRGAGSLCDELGVPLVTESVEVAPQGSVEQNARHARYAAFERHLEPGDLLLLAHHADDQVETGLFRMFREGRLAGMPGERRLGRARLYRPLLETTRAEIEEYAHHHALRWVDDPTNDQLHADRNYLRHEVLPAIEARWPGARQSLRAAVSRADRDAVEIRVRDLERLASFRESADQLRIEGLAVFGQENLVSMLRSWLTDLEKPLPASRMLEEAARRILAGQRVDIVTPDIELREHGGCLYALRALPPVQQVCDQLPVVLESGAFHVPGAVLTNEVLEGQGLKPGDYRLGYRQGGEHMRLRHNRSLKNLLQEAGVPHWLRARLPLVFTGGKDPELVALAGLPDWGVDMLVADGWQAGPGEPGWQFELRLEDGHQAPAGANLH